MTFPRPRLRSLSSKLLVLTIGFVMLAEVLIFTPSIARFRLTFLEDRLADGHLAAYSVLAAQNNMVTMALEDELLATLDAHFIYLTLPDGHRLLLGADNQPYIDIGEEIDLTIFDPWALVIDAYATLLRGGDEVDLLTGPSPRNPEIFVGVAIDQAPLYAAMLDFGIRIFLLSIVISLITASLVFFALRQLMVRPLSQLSETMVSFRNDPQDPDSLVAESGRADEIGVAERELGSMQTAILQALRQRERLAALGMAMAKISHDLRNILATASLWSERLLSSPDPDVQRSAEQLLERLNRAVDLCSRTTTYIGDTPPKLERNRFPLIELLEGVNEDLAPYRSGQVLVSISAPDQITLVADFDELRRALTNVAVNAAQAGATEIGLTGRQAADGVVRLRVGDNGPGLPPRVLGTLFRPFVPGRAGGTGLGLAIAHEIAEAHGGGIRLVQTDETGTAFEFSLPLPDDDHSA